MGFVLALSLFVFGSIALNVNGQDGNQLLMGTLVRQGPTKEAVFRGLKNTRGVEEVQVYYFIHSQKIITS